MSIAVILSKAKNLKAIRPFANAQGETFLKSLPIERGNPLLTRGIEALAGNIRATKVAHSTGEWRITERVIKGLTNYFLYITV